MPITPGEWRIGKAGGAIVTDCPVVARGQSVEDCHTCDNGAHEFYGGHFICESVCGADAELIAVAPALLNLLREIIPQVDLNEILSIEGRATVARLAAAGFIQKAS